jgi:hypothetical protein
MKNKDLTLPVMTKIISFEKKRSTFERNKYRLIILSLIGLLVFGCITVVLQLSERGTLDVIQLFQEDLEIVADYWKDVVSTFWFELPQEMIVFIGLIFVIIIIFWLMTWRQRKIIQSRISQINTFEKGHK